MKNSERGSQEDQVTPVSDEREICNRKSAGSDVQYPRGSEAQEQIHSPEEMNSHRFWIPDATGEAEIVSP